MTALDRFEILESGGLWRDNRHADPRNVTVSFGKTTLVLSDDGGRPLAHWSLPAVQRRNPGQRPALFAPDDDATETLEIEDDLMVDAIEQVRKALITPQAHPGRLRRVLTFSVLAAIVIGAVVWAPTALRQKTLSVVHQSKRAEIGEAILAHYQRLTGPSCRSPVGAVALDKLHRRLTGAAGVGQLVVVEDLTQGAAALPGGRIMFDRRLIEEHDDPAVVSGYILAAIAERAAIDPLEHLLDQAGIQATMSLFTTGDIADHILHDYAQELQGSEQLQPSPVALRAAFDAASVPGGPYLQAIGAAPNLVEAFEGMPTATPRPLIDDSDWVRLQGICGT